MNNKKNIKRIYNIAIIAVIVIALTLVCNRFIHWGNVEYTDDAQVWRHISPINTRVPGFMKEIRFEDHSQQCPCGCRRHRGGPCQYGECEG